MSKVSNSMRQSWVKLLAFVAVQMWKECRTCYSPTLIIWTLIISSVYGDWDHRQTVIFYVYLLQKKAVKKYTTTLKHKHINRFLCWPICKLLYYFIHTWCMIIWIPMSWAKGWAVAHEYLLMCIISVYLPEELSFATGTLHIRGLMFIHKGKFNYAHLMIVVMN